MEHVEVKQEPSTGAEQAQEPAELIIHDPMGLGAEKVSEEPAEVTIHPSAETGNMAISVDTQPVPLSLEMSVGQEEAKQPGVGRKQGTWLNYKRVAAAVLAALMLVLAVGLLVARGHGAGTVNRAPPPAQIQAGMAQSGNGNGNGNGDGNGNGNSGNGAGDDPKWLSKIPPGLLPMLDELNSANSAADPDGLFLTSCQYWVRGYWGKIPGSSQADLEALSAQGKWKKRGDDVVKHLQQQLSDSLGNLLITLKNRKDVRELKPFWIVNAIYVVSSAKTMDFLAKRFEVVQLEEDFYAQTTVTPWSMDWPDVSSSVINMWQMGSGYKGEGIVVANIDTGVDVTHPALSSKYRGDNSRSWYDPISKSNFPIAVGGSHGTHTMGTTVGGTPTDPIGVAPSAKWIACAGCGSSGCPGSALTACAQWMLDPCAVLVNSPSCTQDRPHLVSNSWGGGQGSTWYDQYIQSWRSAGIIPVFSAGNAGPNNYTHNSPGDNCQAIGVGAFDSSGSVASFSSRGPSYTACYKPDFSAPGVSIYSSIAGGGYAYYSGTSMAAPYVAGCIAVMLGRLPVDSRYSLNNYNLIYTALRATTGQNSHDNWYGFGRVKCKAAVLAIQDPNIIASASPMPPPPACNVANPTWVGDGWCDGLVYNNVNCNWDGGDCCPSTRLQLPRPCSFKPVRKSVTKQNRLQNRKHNRLQKSVTEHNRLQKSVRKHNRLQKSNTEHNRLQKSNTEHNRLQKSVTKHNRLQKPVTDQKPDLRWKEKASQKRLLQWDFRAWPNSMDRCTTVSSGEISLSILSDR
eukprot:g13117.t1